MTIYLSASRSIIINPGISRQKCRQYIYDPLLATRVYIKSDMWILVRSLYHGWSPLHMKTTNIKIMGASSKRHQSTYKMITEMLDVQILDEYIIKLKDYLNNKDKLLMLLPCNNIESGPKIYIDNLDPRDPENIKYLKEKLKKHGCLRDFMNFINKTKDKAKEVKLLYSMLHLL